MKTFIWDPRFVTGLETVDQQHHRLVDLINQLGEYMVTDRSETGLEEVFHQLTDYARYHFAEEEQLMRETGLDLRFVEPHVKRHHEFIAQVSAIWRSQGEAHHTSEVLNDFLVAWLAFHILREDQAMTRQIALVRTGESPAVAFEMETQLEDYNVAVLLQ
ncbi:MAG: bacteriohemerythrin, partial [Pseudomonadota bacterium]